MAKFIAKRKCCTCKEALDISLFSWRNKSKGTYSAACKPCHKAYREQHYLDNKQVYVERAILHNQTNSRRRAISRYSYAKIKGYNCLSNMQYLSVSEHRSKSGKEGNALRWGKHNG